MKTLFGYINKIVFPFIPETRCFALKRFLCRLQGYKIGKNVRICSSARIYGPGKIEIGNNVWIGSEAMIISSSFIEIDENVGIGPRVYINTGTHNFGDQKESILGTGINKDIYIKRGSVICACALVLPGIIIEEMTLVAAGAIVTKNYSSCSLLAGVPAKVIKKWNINNNTWDVQK